MSAITETVVEHRPRNSIEALGVVRNLISRQETSLVLVILAIGLAASLRSDAFLTQTNIVQILQGAVLFFVMGCGSALLVIGGGLDFSVGAVFTLAGLTTAHLIDLGLPIPVAMLIGLSAAGLVGVLNFSVITYWHVPPIIATLGTFYILIGVTNQITDGQDVVPLPDAFKSLAQNRVLGIPNPVIFAAIVGIVTWFLLEHTRFGVNVRALGGNRLAAVGNGLAVARLDLAVYAIAALTAGMAGILFASRVGSGLVNAGGATSTLTVITAVLIGGVSLLGGLGTIQGVAAGAILLSLIDNALVLSRISPSYNTIVIGSILIAAVALDHVRRERLYRKR